MRQPQHAFHPLYKHKGFENPWAYILSLMLNRLPSRVSDYTEIPRENQYKQTEVYPESISIELDAHAHLAWGGTAHHNLSHLIQVILGGESDKIL